MKPVDQTTFGCPGGNCNAACLASILELPLGAIPNFCFDVPAGEDWQAAQNRWLAEHCGLAVVTLKLDPDGSLRDCNALADGIWCIISGNSPRGDFSHAVVGRYCLEDAGHRLEYVHDPHPSRAFLDGPAKSIDLFVAVSPYRARQAQASGADSELTFQSLSGPAGQTVLGDVIAESDRVSKKLLDDVMVPEKLLSGGDGSYAAAKAQQAQFEAKQDAVKRIIT